MEKNQKDFDKPKFKTAAEVEKFMRAHWVEYQSNCHEDDCMPFVEYIENSDFLLKGTGWYWNADNCMFLKTEED